MSPVLEIQSANQQSSDKITQTDMSFLFLSCSLLGSGAMNADKVDYLLHHCFSGGEISCIMLVLYRKHGMNQVQYYESQSQKKL